jgi:cell division septum initiation protein DivIVA
MTRTLTAGALLALLLAMTGGCRRARTVDDVMDDYYALAKQYVDVLKTVKDEASLEAAKPKIRAMGRVAANLAKEMKGMKAHRSEAEVKRIFQRTVKEEAAFMNAREAEAQRIAELPRGEEMIRWLREAALPPLATDD